MIEDEFGKLSRLPTTPDTVKTLLKEFDLVKQGDGFKGALKIEWNDSKSTISSALLDLVHEETKDALGAGLSLSVSLAVKEVALESDVTAAVEQFTVLCTKMGAVCASVTSRLKAGSWLASVGKEAEVIRSVAADISMLAEAGIRLRCKPRSRTLTEVTCSAADITSAMNNVKTFPLFQKTLGRSWDKFAIEILAKLEESLFDLC